MHSSKHNLFIHRPTFQLWTDHDHCKEIWLRKQLGIQILFVLRPNNVKNEKNCDSQETMVCCEGRSNEVKQKLTNETCKAYFLGSALSGHRLQTVCRKMSHGEWSTAAGGQDWRHMTRKFPAWERMLSISLALNSVLP